MMIGTIKLLKLVESKNLVENLSERELQNPEGAGFDLRVGEVYKMNEGESAYLGIEERSTPGTKLSAKYGEQKEYTLKPGEYVLVKTMEKTNLPEDMAALFRPRTTLLRSGVILNTGAVAPGYNGELTFGMCNMGNNDFRFDLGSRIAHIMFYETTPNYSKYRGQWQHGRISTEGQSEIQV
jgi:deoxycytidine triphosphate deaminase